MDIKLEDLTFYKFESIETYKKVDGTKRTFRPTTIAVQKAISPREFFNDTQLTFERLVEKFQQNPCKFYRFPVQSSFDFLINAPFVDFVDFPAMQTYEVKFY